MSKKNIVVLCGGDSAEREISLKSGEMIFKNINRKKYNAKLLDTKKGLLKLINLAKDKKIDLAFIALHGPGGEDGTIQGLLESLKIKYIGSGVLASAIGMNKEVTKRLLEANNIKTPRFRIIEKGDRGNRLMPFPFVVKPVNQGSSIGVEIVKNKKEFQRALKRIFSFDKKAIIEEYIKGRELSVPVIGRGKNLKVLPVIEIIPEEQEFFNYKAKYSGYSGEIVPARISRKIAREAQNLAFKVHKIIGCRDISRTDMILKDNKIFVLEINTIPGMTSESLVPKAAKAYGLNFKQLIDYLIKIGLKNDE